MAKAAEKRIQKNNHQVKISHSIIYISILILHVLYKFVYLEYFTFWTITWFIMLNLVTFIVAIQLKSGVDLSQTTGVMSFYWDSLYISWFVLFGYTWYDWFLYFLILMPISLVLMIYSFFRK